MDHADVVAKGHYATVAVGVVTVASTGEQRRLEGQTTNREQASGWASIYEVTGPDDLRLECADITWDDCSSPQRDVRTLERHGSPQRFDRLCHGLRLAVHPAGSLHFVELRQARMKSDDWSNLYYATPEELDDGAATKVARTLRAVGAHEVGTREAVLGDTGRRRRFLCATFDAEANLVPVVAYVVTRVLPVLHRVQA